jgi:hypothetical protein
MQTPTPSLHSCTSLPSYWIPGSWIQLLQKALLRAAAVNEAMGCLSRGAHRVQALFDQDDLIIEFKIHEDICKKIWANLKKRKGDVSRWRLFLWKVALWFSLTFGATTVQLVESQVDQLCEARTRLFEALNASPVGPNFRRVRLAYDLRARNSYLSFWSPPLAGPLLHLQPP